MIDSYPLAGDCITDLLLVIAFDFIISTEDTTPGKPEFNLLKEFSNAILLGWQPPENAGLVCVTGYKIEWGENIPYQFNVGPLRSDKTQYLIKGLSKYIVIFTWFTTFTSTPYFVMQEFKTLHMYICNLNI